MHVQAQLAAVIGLGNGALNEVFELLAAASTPGMVIGDGATTGWGLVVNLAGVVPRRSGWPPAGGARHGAIPEAVT